MQLDMHYYGTYALARAAGLNKDAAKIVATAAQFVDDSCSREQISFQDGSKLYAVATAHHVMDVKNLDPDDQLNIWVPFHFLPGNAGKLFTQRLACRSQSKAVQAMLDWSLSLMDKPFALELLGITAHVLADSFSHDGFSGVSSRWNKIENDSINLDTDKKTKKELLENAERFQVNYGSESFLENFKSWIGEKVSGALGHAAVTTYPDTPYLKWGFTYEESEVKVAKDNTEIYLAASRKLYELFDAAAKNGLPQTLLSPGDKKSFAAITPSVKAILKTKGDKDARIMEWRARATAGLFSGGSGPIPDYDAQAWPGQFHALAGTKDSGQALQIPVCRYYRAANLFHDQILYDILPRVADLALG